MRDAKRAGTIDSPAGESLDNKSLGDSGAQESSNRPENLPKNTTEDMLAALRSISESGTSAPTDVVLQPQGAPVPAENNPRSASYYLSDEYDPSNEELKENNPMSVLDTSDSFAHHQWFEDSTGKRDDVFGDVNTKRIAAFKVFVESLIQKGSLENTPHMISKLALIDQHLKETPGPWKKHGISTGRKLFEVNRNGRWSITLATVQLHAFAHAIAKKQTLDSRPLESVTNIRAVSFPPSVMAAATLGRTRDSISKNNADTPATPAKSTVSKLSAMSSPFQGTKKRKVTDPLQDQIHLIHGGWKPSESIAAIPKSQMKSPPSLPKVNPATSQNTTATNPKSPNTPLTPTPIIAKQTKQMISHVEKNICSINSCARKQKDISEMGSTECK